MKFDLDTRTRAGFAVAAAACDLKLKRLTVAQAEALADTPDDNGATAALPSDGTCTEPQRSGGTDADRCAHGNGFPRARGWRRRCFPAATCTCCARIIRERWSTTAIFPRIFRGTRMRRRRTGGQAWLTYRLGQYDDAARMFADQIPTIREHRRAVSALYWRGRLYETQEH